MSLIYGLQRGDGEIRYVGRTHRTMEQRMVGHVSRCTPEGLRSWAIEGPYNAIILEEVAPDRADEREDFWMAVCIAMGRDLFNVKRKGALKLLDQHWDKFSDALDAVEQERAA